MVRIVTVPLDLSAEADRAIGPATVLARQFGAALELVVVSSPGLDHVGDEAELQARAAQLVGVPASTHVRTGDDVVASLGELADDPDRLVCLASHGRSRLGELVTPSVALSLVHTAQRPAVIVGPRQDWWPGPIGMLLVGLDERGVPVTTLELVAAWAGASRPTSVWCGRRRPRRASQRARHDAHRRTVGELVRRAPHRAHCLRPTRLVECRVGPTEEQPPAFWPRSVRGGPARSRGRRLPGADPCARTRARLRAGRGRTGRRPTSTRRARRSPRAAPPTTPGAAGRRGEVVPPSGHKKRSLFVNAPERTRPQNTPMGRHSSRRRSSRGRADRAAASPRPAARPGSRSVCPNARCPTGRSTTSGQHRARPRSAGSRRRTLRNTLATSSTDSPTYQSSTERRSSSAGVERRVHEEVGVDVLLARHVREVDLAPTRRGAPAPRACSGRRCACFTFHAPSSWRITSIESARTPHARAPGTPGPPRARR